MNIGIIGVGGTGGYFGGKLAKLAESKSDLNVFFVARNEHLNNIQKNGLILNTVDKGEIICKPTLATDNFDELPPLDLCLICVKSYDLNNVLKSVRSKIKDDSVIIALLNGIDIYKRIKMVIQNGKVLPSCVYIGTYIEKYGKVIQNGGNGTILFGQDPKNPGVIPWIFDLFNKAGIKYNWLDHPLHEIWNKYIFIAAYGMVTASENKTFGQIIENADLSKKVIAIMNEIYAIAQKQGIDLPENIVESSFDVGRKFPYDTKTSFQRDFEQFDKPDERELYGNTIINLGKSFGIDTEITKLVNNKLNKIKAA